MKLVGRELLPSIINWSVNCKKALRKLTQLGYNNNNNNITNLLYLFFWQLFATSVFPLSFFLQF